MNAIFFLVVVGVVVIIIYFIWSYLTLRNLRRRNVNNNDVLFDNEKYYELKYKSEFLIASFAVIATVFGFMGYNSFESISVNIKKEILDKTQSIDSSIIITKIKSDSLSNKIEIVDSVALATKSVSDATKKQLNDLTEKINSINSKNKLKENFYVVKDQFFDRRKDGYQKKIFYKHLTTSTGDKLPIFNSPPSISVSSLSVASFNVVNVTTEYFYIQTANGDYQGVLEDTFNFALVFFP